MRLRNSCLTAFLIFQSSIITWGQVSVLTQHNDISRTGANLAETILTPANVTVNTFGKVFTRSVDGQLFAQPLYMPQVTIGGHTSNVVYLATENNTVYAFDADDPAATTPLWSKNLGPAAPSGPLCGSDGMVPTVGITSTPVIDPVNPWMYVEAKTFESGQWVHRLHVLNITTGQEVASVGSPVVITASVLDSMNNPVVMDPRYHLNRTGLLLHDGYIYLGYGSHCDIPPYHGWVLAYTAANLSVQPLIFNVTPNGTLGAVWQGGNAFAADSTGVYMMTANGTFDYDPSLGAKGDIGDSFVRLTSTLAVADYFTPKNQHDLDIDDTDLGSAGPVLLPPMPGTSLSLMLGGGKGGVLYLVNRANFGGFNSSADNVVQSFSAGTAFFTSPVFWNGPGGPFVYLWGAFDSLKQFAWNSGLANFGTSPVATFNTVAPFPGSALSLSANGATNGILWAAAPKKDAGSSSSVGVLHAYDATNVKNDIWNSVQNQSRDDFGLDAKLSPPTVANGKVYMSTFSGVLAVYGLLSTNFSLSALPASLSVPAGQTTTPYTVTLAPTGGFNGTVSLCVNGLPAGATATLNPTTLTGANSSSMTVQTASFTPTGTYVLTVTGSNAGSMYSASVTLVVTSGTPPDFSLSTSPASRTVTAGGNASYTVTMTPVGGFSGTVTYSVSGLPTGITGSFVPPSVSNSTSPVNSTLTITASSTTPSSSYPFTITGNGGTISHTSNATIIVNPAVTLSTLLQLHADASEVSGVTNGSTVTPAVAPAGFGGNVVVKGSGAVNFTPAQSGNGVYFLNCCTSTNNAYYKFTNAAVGNIFNVTQGQISFYLKSRYTFAQRKASAAAARYAFDVRDGNGAHLFAFYTQTSGTQLLFTYIVGGAAQFYFAPAGTEDTLFGNGVVMQVALAWNGSVMSLYLNGTLVKSSSYTGVAPSWTAVSNFDLGAYEYSTVGGYNVSDDVIDEFTVAGPSINMPPPTLSITSPAPGAMLTGATSLVASGTGLTGVQFAIDGNNLGGVVPGSGPTYTTSWDTTTVANGQHTILATATGAALNTSISVMVTNPIVLPVITGVTATAITSSGATINWATDLASSSQVAYGLSNNPYSSSTTQNPALVTSHSVALSQLTPSTTYHYQVLSQTLQGGLGTSGDLTFMTGPSGSQPLLTIHADASEVSGVTNGSIVTPAVAPAGFTGTVVVKGSGSANFTPAQSGNGVYFLNCCTNTNNAYYKFTGATVGNIFNISQGQVSFYLKSRYSFAQRLANATVPRYTFDVRDGNGNHLFLFYTRTSGSNLMFTYIAAGAAQYYFVPAGMEDTLFGNGVVLQVKLTWSGSVMSLYLNGTLVKSSSYAPATPNWTAASNFDLGAYEYSTAGGYNVSEDVIDEFTVAPLQ